MVFNVIRKASKDMIIDLMPAPVTIPNGSASTSKAKKTSAGAKSSTKTTVKIGTGSAVAKKDSSTAGTRKVSGKKKKSSSTPISGQKVVTDSDKPQYLQLSMAEMQV